MKKVLLLGSSVVDCIIQLPHLPHTSEDINILSQHLQVGGCAYNVAHVLRQCLLPHTLLSPIGQGIYGDFISEHFKQHKIPILLRSNAENGCCYCLVDALGERTFLSHHGAEYIFKKEDFDLIQMEDYDSVYVCGLEIEEPTGSILLDFLEDNHFSNIYFAPGPRICHIDIEKLDRLFKLSCILHVNKDEACAFTKEKDVKQAAKHLFSLTNNTVIVTLGEEGSLLYQKDNCTHYPSSCVNVVNTIGAGDTHIGGFIVAQKRGFSLSDSMNFANALSALVVQQVSSTLSLEEN